MKSDVFAKAIFSIMSELTSQKLHLKQESAYKKFVTRTFTRIFYGNLALATVFFCLFWLKAIPANTGKQKMQGDNFA